MSEERPDLAAVLSHYDVTFNPDRASQKILCPVHEEYIESCSINLDEQWFNCHACGAKGDSWNLIMAKEKCDFTTAIAKAEGIARGVGGSGGPVVVAGIFGRTRPAGHTVKRVPFRPRLGRD
jgi:hypothetical protein